MPFPVERVVKTLSEAGILHSIQGSLPDTATTITDDSRRVQKGSMFIAIRGSTKDGHSFIPGAVQNGAACCLLEVTGDNNLPSIVVTDGRRAAGLAAAAANDFPARKLTMLGVTGTNGKTTTTGILRHLFDDPHSRSASIGTVGVMLGSEGAPIPGAPELTTPGPVELHGVLQELSSLGARTIAMEVSSHSLDQRRVEGIDFHVAMFTNLTRDHLDYHRSMEAYFAAKAQLLDLLLPDGVAVINADASWDGLKPKGRALRYGFRNAADVRAENIAFTPAGSEWDLVHEGARGKVALPLFGEFNVENALAASAAALALGKSVGEIAARLGDVPQISGRLEKLADSPTVIRDYAHTPDALERALQAARPFASRRLIVVFGCGGDRDPGKRPLMGQVAQCGADLVILTSDNPRSENPGKIMDEIEGGMSGKSHHRIEDRRAAIVRALEIAEVGDVVLLAGKGHETYQIRGDERIHFDEKEIVAELLSGGAQ